MASHHPHHSGMMSLPGGGGGGVPMMPQQQQHHHQQQQQQHHHHPSGSSHAHPQQSRPQAHHHPSHHPHHHPHHPHQPQSQSHAHHPRDSSSGGSGSNTMGLVKSMDPQERDKYLEKYEFPYCAKVDKYEKMTKIGQGTFGEVFKARLRTDKDKIVALKKVLMENEKEGFPITALREIRILQVLNHENIVNLIEICRQYSRHNKTTFYLVFDFCEHDLAGLLSNVTVQFSKGEIKKVMQQMFEGLYYIHSNKIIHRDMKAANILITRKGILKLADFGLARAISINKNGQPNRYTNRVVTLWYRPPELLLGERNYGSSVDLWGAGCIMAEMWTRSPIMQGNTEQHQLTLIAQLCGAITTEVWPGVDSLELYKRMELPQGSKRRVKERLKPYVKDQYACDLIDKLLSLDPNKRINSDNALNHDFFWTDPMPCSLERTLSSHVSSMFEYLAPRRGGAHMQHHQQQQQQQQQQQAARQQHSANEGYKDIVY